MFSPKRINMWGNGCVKQTQNDFLLLVGNKTSSILARFGSHTHLWTWSTVAKEWGPTTCSPHWTSTCVKSRRKVPQKRKLAFPKKRVLVAPVLGVLSEITKYLKLQPPCSFLIRISSYNFDLHLHKDRKCFYHASNLNYNFDFLVS